MQLGSKNPPFLPASEMCAHTRGLAFGTSCSHPAQPCPAQRATVPGPCGRALPRGHMSEAQGRALLAHSCSRPQTKGISRHGQHGVCGSSSRARECGTVLPPAPALLLGRDSTGTAQGQHRDTAQPPGPALGQGVPGVRFFFPHPYRHICPGSSPVLVVDVVPKARGVDDGQLHANPLLLDLCNEKEAAV